MESLYSYINNKYKIFIPSVYGDYKTIFRKALLEDNNEDVKKILKASMDWVIDVQSSKIYAYTVDGNQKECWNSCKKFLTRKYKRNIPKDFGDNIDKKYDYDNVQYNKDVYIYETDVIDNFVKPIESKKISLVNVKDDDINKYCKNNKINDSKYYVFFSVGRNIYVDNFNEYEGPYGRFYEICENLSKDDKESKLEWFKEYFYKEIVERYRTRGITDMNFDKLEIGEYFRAVPKVYERLNSKAGMINSSNTFAFNKTKDKENIHVYFENIIAKNSYIGIKIDNSKLPNWLLPILTKTDVGEFKQNIINEYFGFARVVILPKLNEDGIENFDINVNSLYKDLNKDLKIIDFEIVKNDKVYDLNIYFDYKISNTIENEYRDLKGYVILGKLTQTLMDNVVSNINSSNLINFYSLKDNFIVSNPNTKYDAIEYNSLFDDRDIDYIVKYDDLIEIEDSVISDDFNKCKNNYRVSPLDISGIKIKIGDEIKTIDVDYVTTEEFPVISGTVSNDGEITIKDDNINKGMNYKYTYHLKNLYEYNSTDENNTYSTYKNLLKNGEYKIIGIIKGKVK